MIAFGPLQFLWPWVFVLLPLPWLLRRSLATASENNEAALKVPYLQDFSFEHSAVTRTHRRLPVLLYTLAWCALLIAAARPQYVGDAIELPVSGRDLMLAVDLSGSMETRDFMVNGRILNRLQATKYVASDFIERRVGDRIGLILFGEQAYLQSPLTFDRVTINTFLQEAALGLAGKATAIGDAIGLALKRLRQTDDRSDNKTDNGSDHNEKVLILLTDGASNAGELQPRKAAELAAREGLKIYTIGIGASRNMSTFGLNIMRGMNSDLDEATLKAVAQITGGRYFRAHNTKELAQIYQILDKLEPVEHDTKSYRPTSALFVWPLAFALGLALLMAVLPTLSRPRA